MLEFEKANFEKPGYQISGISVSRVETKISHFRYFRYFRFPRVGTRRFLQVMGKLD
jgi:hypothetical protein